MQQPDEFQQQMIWYLQFQQAMMQQQQNTLYLQPSSLEMNQPITIQPVIHCYDLVIGSKSVALQKLVDLIRYL